MKFLKCLLLVVCFCQIGSSQRNFVNNNNLWFVYIGDHKIHKNWGIHLEYQERRSEWGGENQQHLFRAGINYHLLPQAFITLGYAFVWTYPYGELPVLKAFPEHRIYQQLQIKNNLGSWESTSRFRTEQRWLKSPIRDSVGVIKLGKEIYLGRFRYLHKFSFPLNSKIITERSFYGTLADELFVNIGKNVAKNIFDQNRFFIGFGYVYPNLGRIELGYLHHRLFKGDGLNVENNHTIQISLSSALSFVMKKEK